MKGRLLRCKRGSVSVFLSIVAASIFLFVAVFIDYARIAALNKLTEDASRAGVRSTLSAFDRELYESFGLFGRGGTDGNQLFEETVRARLEPASSREGGFGLIDAQVGAAIVQPQFTLGLNEVLLGQVLEEMKYKAPVDFTMELAAKLRPLSGAVKEAARTNDLLQRLKQRYESRRRHLGEALAAMRNSAAGEAAFAASADPAIQASASFGALAAWTAQAAANAEGAASENAGSKSGGSGSEPGEGDHAAALDAFRSSASQAASELATASATLASEHGTMRIQALAAISAAESDNAAMEAMARQARVEPAAGGGDGRSGSSSAETEQAAASLSDMRRTIEGMALPPEWFAGFRDDVERLSALGSGLAASGNGLSAALSNAVSVMEPSFGTAVSAAAGLLQGGIAGYQTEVLQPQSGLLDRREAAVLKIEAEGGERRAYERKAEKGWREARSLLGRLGSLGGSHSVKEEFRKLDELRTRNAALNAAALESPDAGNAEETASPPPSKALAENADEASESAFSRTDGMLDGMADVLSGLRNRLYVGEYAVSRFRAFTPDQARVFIHLPSGEVPGALPGVAGQEAEYLLYGFADPAANIGAAYAEVFAFRLAVRTMEGFIKCRSLGHPLAILAAAAAYGVEHALADMTLLLERGAIPLSDYAKVEVSYIDYLRLFFLAHGGSRERLQRMTALIEHRTGVELAAVPAGLSGEVTASMKLWFLPGVMRMLERIDILRGKVKAGRYETTKTASLSY